MALYNLKISYSAPFNFLVQLSFGGLTFDRLSLRRLAVFYHFRHVGLHIDEQNRKRQESLQ